MAVCDGTGPSRASSARATSVRAAGAGAIRGACFPGLASPRLARPRRAARSGAAGAPFGLKEPLGLGAPIGLGTPLGSGVQNLPRCAARSRHAARPRRSLGIGAHFGASSESATGRRPLGPAADDASACRRASYSSVVRRSDTLCHVILAMFIAAIARRNSLAV